jgi:hypothetical protein
MSSLTKFLKSSGKKAKKWAGETKKTIKDQPFSLGAGVLTALSEMAQDSHDAQHRVPGARSPLSSLLKGAGTMTQAWTNAKAAQKRGENAKAARAILTTNRNAEGEKIKTSQKVDALFAMGEDKLAEKILKMQAVRKNLKYKKKSLGETSRMNDYSIFDTDRKFAANRSDRTEDNAFKVNTDKRDYDFRVNQSKIQQGQFEQGLNAKASNNIIHAISNAVKGKATADDMLFLIKNPSLVNSMRISHGIPFTGIKNKVDIGHSHFEADNDDEKSTKNRLKKFFGI